MLDDMSTEEHKVWLAVFGAAFAAESLRLPLDWQDTNQDHYYEMAVSVANMAVRARRRSKGMPE